MSHRFWLLNGFATVHRGAKSGRHVSSTVANRGAGTRL